jgi:hypothetical protein
VTQNKASLFGEISGGEMKLNDAGEMIQSVWMQLSENYRGVNIDAFVVMPNHIHGILFLVGAGPSACPELRGQPPGVAPTLSVLTDTWRVWKNSAGYDSAAGFGSEIISSTSSATKGRWSAFANISSTIQRAGNLIVKTPEAAKPEPVYVWRDGM